MYIPACYYNTSLINLIDYLIDEGFKSYSSLSDAERDRIIALCIESLGDDSYSCIIDSDHMMLDLKRYVLSCKHEDALKLACHLHEAAINYFCEPMTSLFEERLNHNRFTTNIESNLYQYGDRINGETQWRRIA